MSERFKDGADPDATVMLPVGGAKRPPEDDATVMMPAAPPEDDATVMVPSPAPDDDATVMVPAAAPEDDATVMMPAAGADEDATVMMPARTAEDDATVMMPAAEGPDPEATIAIPTPGRKREAEAPVLPAAPETGGAAAVDLGELGGLNPLVAAANPVLAAVAQIRHTLRHPDPQALKAGLRERVDAFDAAARAAGASGEAVSAARYALEALVNESAASTPWGADWATDGGERFFELLAQHSADAAANRDLLEFLYSCLALGFEGPYRRQAEGRQALAEIRARLLAQLREQRPPRDGELSGHWRGAQVPERRPAGALGFWLAGTAAALLLAALYIGYSVSLGGLSDPVARELAQLRAAVAPQVTRPAAKPAPVPDIAGQLAGEIARGEVAVVDAAGRSTIVIRSDRLFASGSTRLEAGVEPVVLRVAAALDRVPGAILVTGHTDDVPIRTARFPSNWELSTERAATVVKLMSGRLKDPSRLRAEGLADSAPAAPNDSAANRARNRRVEIVLRSAP
jgi:type VI secretion system protein ImpK